MARKCQVRLMSVKWRQQSWQGRVASTAQHKSEPLPLHGLTATFGPSTRNQLAILHSLARTRGLDGQARLGLDRAEGDQIAITAIEITPYSTIRGTRRFSVPHFVARNLNPH